VRAEGFEPSRSLEHRHLKPACLPFHHARKPHERTAFDLLSSWPWPPPASTAGYFLGMSTTRRRRLALIVLVVFAAGGCLALGWWQWTRFQSTSGTFQNLGYALQWPAFAGFCVYAYRKFVRYEEAPPEHRNTHTVNEIPEGLLPERPKLAQQKSDDTALRDYNTYLAELAKADNETDRKQNRTTA
jgi:DNA-binding transcriptional regulator of glucitol operon